MPVSICDVPLGPGKAWTWRAEGDILMTNVQTARPWREPATAELPLAIVVGWAPKPAP